MHIVTADFSLLPGEGEIIRSSGGTVHMFRAYGSHDRTSHIDGWTEVQPYKIGRAYGSFRAWPFN